MAAKELNKVFVAQLPDSEKGDLARLVYAEQGVVIEHKVVSSKLVLLTVNAMKLMAKRLRLT